MGVGQGPGRRLGVGVPDHPSARVRPQADFAELDDVVADPDELLEEPEVDELEVAVSPELFDPFEPDDASAVVFSDDSDDEDFSDDEPDPARASLR